MSDRIQFRRDTAERWSQFNPFLLEGEIGIITDDPNLYKIGDGVHYWNDLPLRGFNGNVVDDPGQSESAVMSQKAVTEFVNKNIVDFDDYIYKNTDLSELYLGTLYNNAQLIPTISSGYISSEINNPIADVNIDKIPQYKKTGGQYIYPVLMKSILLGKKTGVWVNSANYVSTFRIHCGAENAEHVQRDLTYVDIDLTTVQIGNIFGVSFNGITISAKCSAKSSGYVYFEIVVTSSNILDVYYNIIPYETGGARTGVDYQILLIKEGNDPYLKPYKIKVGDIMLGDNRYEKLCLPDKFIFEKGKSAMLFKRSMFKGINYRNYNIQIIVTDDTQTVAEEQKWCKDYDRYIQYTPTEVGEVNARIILYDNNRNILDYKDIILKTIERTTQPSSEKTVLFIGDSLTYYNRITDEFYRVLTSNDSATTAQDTISIYTLKKPAGRNWGNITLIGTQKNDYKGWIGQTYHEGMSGWQWLNFIQGGSPFVYNRVLDFDHYLTANSFNTPDVVYIGLGWNDQRSVSVTDNGKNIDVSPIMANVKTFLDAITTQWPTTKVRLWTENITGIHGGIGNHPYGANEWADEQRANLIQFAIMEGYKALIQQYENVDIVWSTAFIDTEYSLQEENADINTRIDNKEVRGVDYVHPADAGFFQIADAIIADFCSLL